VRRAKDLFAPPTPILASLFARDLCEELHELWRDRGSRAASWHAAMSRPLVKGLLTLRGVEREGMSQLIMMGLPIALPGQNTLATHGIRDAPTDAALTICPAS
jgi:hypothetical protein